MGNSLRRGTIGRTVELPAALGAISRRAVKVALEPAAIGSGLRVRRTDIGREWPVDLERVVPVPNCTAIGEGVESVAFVEHLMAALRASLISDVLIVTDGPELPLYDGSAVPFWSALQEAGRAESATTWEPLVIREALEVGEGQGVITGRPATRAHLSYELAHPHPLIGEQAAGFGEGEDFGRVLAPARTFATAEEITALYGMAPTPEMETLCVIVYPDRVSAGGLPGAFARHKLLDLMGDLYLCGRPIRGEVRARRSGHSLNRAFLRALLAREPAGQS